jgi:hypothetical protein
MPSYYLKYRNKRVEYIDNFWKIVDWKSVMARYREAIFGGAFLVFVLRICATQILQHKYGKKNQFVIVPVFV